jgi:hypothetical protein
MLSLISEFVCGSTLFMLFDQRWKTRYKSAFPLDAAALRSAALQKYCPVIPSVKKIEA